VPRRGAQLAAFGLERGERAVGLRDRPLGVAQRVARLAAGALLAVELLVKRAQAAAQQLELFLPRRRFGGGCDGAKREP
jgi:hypothetical protein